MPGFTTTTTLASTPGAAFAYVVTLSNGPTFRGFGPLPGIARAEVSDGAAIALGTRVNVRNTDDA